MARLHGGKWKVGDIRLWFKPEIPRNWVLCDGNNGTPKTTGRVVVGASNNASEVVASQYEIPALGDLAGNKTVTPTGSVNSHTLSSAELASHQHNDGLGLEASSAAIFGTNTYSVKNFAQITIGSNSSSRGSPKTSGTGGNAAHSHGLSLSAIDVRQKSVGVYYIMKIR